MPAMPATGEPGKRGRKLGAGGWFHTGDQGFLDGDGFLTLTGRLKELINRGGEKISPMCLLPCQRIYQIIADIVNAAHQMAVMHYRLQLLQAQCWQAELLLLQRPQLFTV